MRLRLPIRDAWVALAAAAVVCFVLASPAQAQYHRGFHHGPRVYVQPPVYAYPAPGPAYSAPPQGHPPLAQVERQQAGNHQNGGEHLAQWMQQHSQLSSAQQQQALGEEPGFRDLPAATQQRMRQRLGQLDAMDPAERQRVIAHTEVMERLSPDQRGQVRNAMGQLSALPADRRRIVEHTFRGLRALNPEQRAAYLNDPRVRAAFSPQEMTTLNGLMRVEPLLPRSNSPAPPPQ
jgi:hypothetical protein